MRKTFPLGLRLDPPVPPSVRGPASASTEWYPARLSTLVLPATARMAGELMPRCGVDSLCGSPGGSLKNKGQSTEDEREQQRVPEREQEKETEQLAGWGEGGRGQGLLSTGQRSR